MSGRGGRGGGRDGGRVGGRGDGGRGGGRGDGGRGRAGAVAGGGRGGAVPGGRGGGFAGAVGGGRGYDTGGRGGPVAGQGYAAAGGYRDQPTLSQSYGRGEVNVAPVAQSVVPVAQSVVPVALPAAAVSTESITRDVEKLTVGSSSGEPEMETAVVKVPTSGKRYGVALRPSYGKEGRRCMIRANHFLVKVADNDLHHYDVTIRPEVINKKVCREIMKNLDESFRKSLLGNRQIAYDGSKSLYTAGALPFLSKDFVVKLEDKDRGARREREFKVSIKFASKPDVHHLKEFLARRQLDMPHETIQLFDVVLRAQPSEDYTVFGRSFFNLKFGAGDLGDGLHYWKGFYQSLRPTQMGLSLNIDMSATAFHDPVMVSEFVGKLLRKNDSRALTDPERMKVRKSLRGMRVEFRHGDYMRRYKVLSISTPPLSQLTFVDETGGRISVAQYFQNKYKINLSYTFLPALNAGTDAKPTYLPMEVCKIVEGQRCSKKLNERQVTNLLRATCQRPYERESSINRVAGENRYNNNPLVKEFGIQVGPEMACIEARVLNPPKLKYHASSKTAVIEPRVGQWNMIDKRMFEGGRVEHWTCINFSSKTRPDVVHNFCGQLLNMCSNRGIEFNPQPLIPFQPGNPRSIDKSLLTVARQCEAKLQNTGKQLQLLIVVLPDFSGSYGTIKRTCETSLDIVSQCCQPKHVLKCNGQYLENLSLKINVKVGGRNALLVNAPPFIRDKVTIIFGADVTHPSPGEDSSPSIAAVVASMDWPDVTKYRALYSAQGHRDEIIKDLYSTQITEKNIVLPGGMIRDHLRAFYAATRRRPDRIIFYRDGVSEGQFNQVLLEEMDAIRKACQSLQEDYLPPVTFVVVQKRHHTRLFPANHGDKNLTDRSGNILPGTVVDTSICHPTEFDFYLCSHAGIQGTSRPTHYHVLYDENRFTADALQALTNNLTYTYARCTRSVSIVPAAYYAHLVAFRARYYMEADASDGDSGGGDRPTRQGDAAIRAAPNTSERVKAVMFYC